MEPCQEQRGLAVGCLYLDIEGQSWLLDNVNGGFVEN